MLSHSRVVIRIRRAVLLTGLATTLACGYAPAQPADSPATVAFRDVNVVPMDREQTLHNQTVVVENGVITAVSANIAVPPDARIIDGKGGYLCPGLADMHTHAETSNDMKVYLANGVTTVLHMGGASNEFMGQRRPLLNTGRRPGPYVYAAFRVDGSPRYGQFVITTADEARWIVRLAKTNGYEFMKVYNDLSPECFSALINEARQQQMAVVGHGVTNVGLEKQLDAGQRLVAHVEEFFYTTFASHSADKDSNAAPDEELIAGAISFVKRDKAFVTADLNTYATIADQWGQPAAVKRYLRSPQARYLSPDRRLAWLKEDYVTRHGSLAARLTFLVHFIKALNEAGVPLIAGTDAPTIPGLVPGYSLHDDLRALVNAGLTPYQALATATRTAGEFVRATISGARPFGMIAPGNRADVILSPANPFRI